MAAVTAAAVPATFAAGCYWGTEHFFVRKFKDAIVTHAVGFMGGSVVNNDNDNKQQQQHNGTTSPHKHGDAAAATTTTPRVTYEMVKKGNTGHAEVLHLTYDPHKVTYEQLLEFFFRMHNSTTRNRQEGDVGTNYRSAIFYHDEAQRAAAAAYIAKLNGGDAALHAAYAKAFGGASCVTTLEPASTFYPAHEAHQDYLDKNPDGYCAHRIYF